MLADTDQILSGNSEVRLEIEKMMNALTIAYEAPSLPELAILTSLDDVDKLQRLIRICEPIIRVETSGEQRGSVTFSHSRFLERLRDTALGGQVRIGAQKRQYHGVVALRWFQHMQTTNFSSTTEDNTSDAPAGLKRSSTVARRSNEDATVFIVATDEDDAGKGEEIPHPRSNSICSYPNKYLFRHLNEAFPDASEEVRDQDPAFWSLDSALDYRWLKKFQDLIPDFRGLADIGLSVRGMSALHVVAITGGAELVSVLLERKGKTTVARTSNDGMTPVSYSVLSHSAQSDVISFTSPL